MTDCPYDEESCYEDDFESLCDGCREDRGQAYLDGMMIPMTNYSSITFSSYINLTPGFNNTMEYSIV